jgi:hypothetical protein
MMIRDPEYYQREYVEKERSTHDIAWEHGTYPNKIRRELKNFGYELRDRSEAQSAALRHGRHGHPTRGRVTPDVVRERISQSLRKGPRHAASSSTQEGQG